MRIRLDEVEAAGAKYILSRGKGRHVESKIVAADEVCVVDIPPALVDSSASFSGNHALTESRSML